MRLRKMPVCLEFRHVERLHGTCPVDPDVLIELSREHRLEVVAGEFALRTIDHADRALETRFVRFLK
jgi:hypothetical protein